MAPARSGRMARGERIKVDWQAIAAISTPIATLALAIVAVIPILQAWCRRRRMARALRVLFSIHLDAVIEMCRTRARGVGSLPIREETQGPLIDSINALEALTKQIEVFSPAGIRAVDRALQRLATVRYYGHYEGEGVWWKETADICEQTKGTLRAARTARQHAEG